MSETLEKIKNCLRGALAPVHLEIQDDSHAHAGHPGAMASGGGHYSATIVSEAFQDKSPMQRHRLVYQALGDMMRREIHALSIKAFTPTEYQQGLQK